MVSASAATNNSSPSSLRRRTAQPLTAITTAPNTAINPSSPSDHRTRQPGQEEAAIFEELLARRDGSVLARNTILKSDQFGSAWHSSGGGAHVEVELLGAPNFRKATLNVFGVAQPTTAGLSTLMRLLRCGPHAAGVVPPEQTCSWFSTREEPLIYINGRPFVLRNRNSPFENIRSYAGISASRLEQMEARLKTDILEESAHNNGLLLVHDETEELQIQPCFTAIDSVKTSAEVFADMRAAGFSVAYHRVPVSHEQSPTDAYIDEYIRIFEQMPLQNHAIIFSCGIGVGRTTYAMVLGMLIRRAHLIASSGIEDPFVTARHFASEEDQSDRTILRLIYVLEQGLQSKYGDKSAVEWTLGCGKLIDGLKAAVQGNYQVIMELIRALEEGMACKRIVDEAIDQCQTLLNIREHILINRVRHVVDEESSALDTGIGYLERYFSLIAFCAYMNAAQGKGISFRAWIKDRRDVWNMLQSIRKSGNSKLLVFRPVDDLSALGACERAASLIPPVSPYLRTDEMAEYHIIKSRAGSVLGAHTILKIDHWKAESLLHSAITGAPNFRQIRGAKLYATAQPTLSALRAVLEMIRDGLGPDEHLCWINVREEPLVYIENEPYVLRDRYATLRNIKSYAGITSERLEQMEQRLKEDILNEAALYNNRILVHCEASEEHIHPSWMALEDESDILTPKEVFADLASEFPFLTYKRIPMTSEEAPEPEHFDSILRELTAFAPGKLHVIFNCQMGTGRSTTGTVIASQIFHWFETSTPDSGPGEKSIPKLDCSQVEQTHYKIIQSLLRLIRNGLECKCLTDMAIDAAAVIVNLRTIIEECRQQSESTSEPIEQRRMLRKGISSLRRYFMLILFQAYLSSACPDDELAQLETFTSWMGRHLEFRTLLNELDKRGDLETLHADHLIRPDEGIALTTEVLEVVKHRPGSVLAPMTILKFDHFPGCQRMSLPERIDGAPNFREVVLLPNAVSTYGLAMPTKQGVRRLLDRINRSVLWICLREEPVVYVLGKPYVLRVVKDPVVNLEMTGIISERVELLEARLKADILVELQYYGGKLLLHEEEAETGLIVPVWEAVTPEDIETTAEIMEKIRLCGYPLDYLRIPMTDEQAPIPAVFDQLVHLVYNQTPREKSATAVYNCQMGRGRTTTGMVIFVLIYYIAHQELFSPAQQQQLAGTPKEEKSEKRENSPLLEELTRNGLLKEGREKGEGLIGGSGGGSRIQPKQVVSHREQADLTPEQPGVQREQSKMPRDHSGMENSLSRLDLNLADSQRYLAGEYKLVLQLVQVLEHGKTAKRLVDLAIDRCSHIQNLREAIYDYKLRASASTITEEVWERGLNYLLRYFFLIIFAEYLLQSRELTSHGAMQSCRQSFVEWLDERREIQNMISRRDHLDFS